MSNNPVLLALSSLLLVGAYYAPDHTCFLVFLFLIPLFFLALTYTQESSYYWFWSGFVWGLLFFSIHWITFIPLFLNHACGWFRMMLYPILVIYASIWTGLWFFICSLFSKRIAISWTVGTFLYLYLFEHYALVPFGCCAGYPFINPIILLASDARWCRALPLLGRYFFLFLLILFQIGCASLLKTKRRCVLFLSVLCLIPFAYGWFFKYKKEGVYKDLICPVIPSDKIPISYLDAAQEITSKLLDATIENPNAQVLIMPESAFPFCLNNYPEVVEMWVDNVLYSDKILIIGSQYLDKENQLFNTVYVINKGRITQTYNKKHLMPFFEYIPYPFTHFPLIHTTFFPKEKPFLPSGSTHSLLFLNPYLKHCTIAVCSEFFLKSTCYTPQRGILLVLANDNWFLSYFKHLLSLYARLHAYEHEMPLLYVSFSAQECFFTKYRDPPI